MIFYGFDFQHKIETLVLQNEISQIQVFHILTNPDQQYFKTKTNKTQIPNCWPINLFQANDPKNLIFCHQDF